MATKRELTQRVQMITSPTKMSLRQALAIEDSATALHAFVSHVSETTQLGADLARDYYAMCVINSGGVSALFLTGALYESLSGIRSTLERIGAHRTLAALDEISTRVSSSPAATQDPGVVILSDDFEAWEKFQPHAQELAGEVQKCLLAYVRENVERFENAKAEPELVMALAANPAEMEELARKANVWRDAADEADAHEFELLIIRMVQRGQRLDAVRAWRRRYGCPVIEANEAVARLGTQGDG